MLEYKELKIDMIEEGLFKDDINKIFANLQKQHGKLVDEWKHNAVGTVSELNIKIKLKCTSHEDNTFLVGTDIKQKMPCRPARVSMALMDKNEKGDACLYTNSAGSSHTHPNQSVLFNGEKVDENGEIIKEGK